MTGSSRSRPRQKRRDVELFYKSAGGSRLSVLRSIYLLHSAGAASRLAALLIARIVPICSHFAPGHPGAAPLSVYTYIELRTLVPEARAVDLILPNFVADNPVGGVEQFGSLHPVAAGRLEGVLQDVLLVGTNRFDEGGGTEGA